MAVDKLCLVFINFAPVMKIADGYECRKRISQIDNETIGEDLYYMAYCSIILKV